MRRSILAAGAFVIAAAAACSPSPSPLPPPTAIEGPVEVTILYTSDEHGWLLPRSEKGMVSGGAAEVLGRWIAFEGHCPGPPSPPCPDPRTLLLSGGDNFTGPAISTYFDGAPMAEAMARMGYAASAFGNHELDFGWARFVENRKASGVAYLAANWIAPAGHAEDKALPAHRIFTRKGIKIGVVGLATDTTLRAAMASRFEGITFAPEEAALGRAVSAAWADGADAVVAIAHECHHLIAPIVARHPEWKLSFVGAGHCHKVVDRWPETPVIAPGWRLDNYARVRFTADPSRPPGKRVLTVSAEVVSTSRPEGTAAPAPADPELARAAAGWKAKVDAVLGEPIGFAASGFEKDAPEMGRWIAGAIRAEMGVDVAVVNVHGMRQSLPPGPITKAHVWSILPFDNQVVVMEIDGAGLAENLRLKEAVAQGVSRDAQGGFVLEGGKPLDPTRLYQVATVDYLYFGGDHFTFEARARAAEIKHADWRDVVIAWTKRQLSSAEAPIEGKLAR